MYVGVVRQRKKPQPTLVVSAELWFLGPFHLDREVVTEGPIWNFSKGKELLWLGIRVWGTKVPSKGLGASGPKGFDASYYLCLHNYNISLCNCIYIHKSKGKLQPLPPGAWLSVSCDCCVLWSRGVCDRLITRPEESCRAWCVWVWPRKLSNEAAYV